jgi:hypothetical protein
MHKENKDNDKFLNNNSSHKIKWVFLMNNAPFLMEFLGRFANEIINQGDECICVINSKLAEYDKKKFFPNKMKFISKIDWCIKNYRRDKKEFNDLSWRKVFFIFDRSKRLNFTYNNSLEMVSQLYQFFEFIFEKEKPDIILSEPVSGLFNGIAYHFSELKGLPYLGFLDSRFRDRIDIYDSEETYSEYAKTFIKLNNNNFSEREKVFAKNFVQEFVSHKKLPSYIGSAKIYFSHIGIIKHYIKRIKELGRSRFQYFLNRKYFKEFDYESEDIFKNTFYMPFQTEKRKFRILFQKNIFNFLDDFKNNQKFFLFPLHVQPESSTSVLATYLYDQLNTIKNIAFTLPFPYKLYVKEHPVAIGTRTRSFYKKLKKIPNLVLISPDENVENLIKKSSGIITLTSTIGLEAALVGKLVYILGDVFYTYHPACIKINSFKELEEKIKDDLVNRKNLVDLESINLRFIVSYLRNTIAGSIVKASSKNDINNYQMIYKKIKEIITK